MTRLDMDALTEPQRNVLSAIAINEDGGHNPRVLKALEAKGLIVGYSQVLPAVGVRITQWEVPIAVHIQWAEWCSRQVEETE